MELLAAPIATAEFLVIDTETNGLGGEACEMTEVGAVLVGGGELHDRWSSLVRTSLPLRRGIQRFTGITQAMVDDAPSLETVLPEIHARLEGRVMVAHNAPFDQRVLRAAFERIGLPWPEPPVICTAALARAVAPLQRERGLSRLADALGIEVRQAHRALADAETCGRVLCALFPRLCAHAATVAEALELLAPRRRRRRTAPRAPRSIHPTSPVGVPLTLPGEVPVTSAGEVPLTLPGVPSPVLVGGVSPTLPPGVAPDFRDLPRDPGVYLFRDGAGRVLYVGKSISIRSRARSHFAPSAGPAAWAAHAAVVDYRVTRSELGALVLENRLIKELGPPGNQRLTRRDDRLVYIRCRLDIPFPILEVAPDPAAGHAVTIGPLRGRRLALELVEQLDSLFGLRHCGRRLPRRQHPSAYGQMGRCLSPCLGDLDPNLYRRRLDEVLRLFVGAAASAGAPLLAHVESQMREAGARQQFERAASLRRRAGRLRVVLGRLDGVLEATHSRPRLLLAPHPSADTCDGFWLAGGRLVDWGPIGNGAGEPGDLDDLEARTAAALARGGRVGELGAHVPPDEVDEVRIIGSWLASHPATPQLPLHPVPDEQTLREFVQSGVAQNASALERKLNDDRLDLLRPDGHG